MKSQLEQISGSEKILAGLSGHFELDKKTLISSIHALRAKNAPAEECKALGAALYRLLLDNGLNESDVINSTRLYEKLDGFVFNDQPEVALAILEVLDAVTPYQRIDKDGYRVYCFQNEIEAEIFKQDGIVVKTISWLPNLRTVYLAKKARILIDNNRTDEANDTVKELIELNPVSFEAHVLLGQTYRKKKPAKFRQELLRAMEYAYTPTQFIELFSNLYDFYADKQDWISAYAVLSAIKLYDVSEPVFAQIEELRQKMKRTVVTAFKEPSAEQILRILEKEGIDVQISARNYSILLDVYEKYFLQKTNPAFMKIVAEFIQGFAGEEDIIKIVQKRIRENAKK